MIKTSIKNTYLSILAAIMLLGFISQADAAVRVKDIARIDGVRENQLLGYGIVVGLNGTGDSASTSFTYQSIVTMLEKMGVQVNKNEISISNVAAVIVTAKLPPFVRAGTKIDVSVASLGTASDLSGGMLLMTPLKAANGSVYAVAQGPVSIGGFNTGSSDGSISVQKNHPTVGRIPEGAFIEKEVPVILDKEGKVTILLRNPDFTTAERLAEKINAYFKEKIASAEDAGSVVAQIPEKYNGKENTFISEIETLEIDTDISAKIVINERTGTIVAGENVKISKVAVSHGNLSIEIKTKFRVSQPLSFAAQGETAVTPDREAYVEEEKSRVIVVENTLNIGQVASVLNALGVTPRDMISIFQTMREAGALQAELVIM